MTAQLPTGVKAEEHLVLPEGASLHHGGAMQDEYRGIKLSRELRADLDSDAWGQILEAYGRTVKLAVALTDTEGRMLGPCHNAQPVWTLLHDTTPGNTAGCPFCLASQAPCTAIADALQSGAAVMVRDQAGLTHVAVPLALGDQNVGAIVAGQVFDQFPEPLPLRRVAKEFGVPAQQLWQLAGKQHVVIGETLQVYGDLLGMLGQAFLRQRYSAILEKTLAERNRQFRLLVEGANDYALFTMDAAGRVTSWNAGAERLLGYAGSDIVGQKFSRIFTAEDIQDRVPEKQLHKASREGRTEDEGWRVRENRTQFWANVMITALVEEAGPLPSFAIIIQDVSEKRKAAMELEQTRQDRVRLQERFLSHVSHELRTPLTAIYFFTTNLLEGVLGDLTEGQRQHLEATLENVKQLKNMVSDLLDVTRVKTLKLSVKPQCISVARLVNEALNTCRANAAAKNIGLHADLASSFPLAWADPIRVRQILINLIDNGIKFTPEKGSVTVQGQVFTEDDNFICLSVTDTGRGISPEYTKIVFDHLVQVEAQSETSRKGLGLGLYISRELVSQQGGRIWLESRLGHGSTFYFTLPAFSLAKLCAPLFTPTNLAAGCVTLLAVDIAKDDGAVPAELWPEVRKALAGCIVACRDALLPDMSETEAAGTLFIVAFVEPGGGDIVMKCIRRRLQEFDHASQLRPTMTLTTLQDLANGEVLEKQIGNVITWIKQGIHTHMARKHRRR
jgi:PAS domain S-box-containing protein